MINFKLLEPTTVFTWVFRSIEKEEDAQNQFLLYWEVLNTILHKLVSRSEIFRDDLRKVILVSFHEIIY